MSQQLATKPETTMDMPEKRDRLVVSDESPFSNLLDTARFDHIWRVSQMFAASKLVPQHFQGDAYSCFVATQMAVRLGVDPFMFMQNTYVIQGKPGMEAKLAIALVNSSGIFEGPIQWKIGGEGKARYATAFAKHAKTGEVCECTVTMAIAEAEGWLSKSGSKWKTMPDQMLRYRSATWFARLYCPERLMGMDTADELEDIEPPRKVVSNTSPGTVGLLGRLAEADGTFDPEQAAGADDGGVVAEQADTAKPAPIPTIGQVVHSIVQTATNATDPEVRSKAIGRWCEAKEIDPAELSRPSDGSPEANAVVEAAQKCKLWETYVRD